FGDLHRLRTERGLSRVSSLATAQHSWISIASARLLLLPPLRWPFSLGPNRWTYAQAFNARCRRIDHLGRHHGREFSRGRGKTVEGRMPYVAMVFNPVPDLPVGHPHRLPATVSMQARYLSGLYTLEELGKLLRRQAGQVGMNHAQQWIGLSDGGNGLENFLKINFPGPLEHGTQLALILDFWHA